MGLNIETDFGQTPLSEEEKEDLIISTISNKQELDEFEQINIESAVEWSMKQVFKMEQIVSVSFILKLHKRMFGQTWKWAGKFRQSNKNLGIDKYQIPQELTKMIDDCQYWIENNIYLQDEIAIRLKHRLVSIHPFANGNGRHSRLYADILISHGFKRKIFSWGQSSFTSRGEAREKYLSAVRKADKGDIQALVKFARL
ncbi:MAG: mobile mystery protein B [Candidatus Marinimicrobia bacterium]|jgi:Fic-DOC domain mobile mystery protein B|nr:mobile mystery protein B [Candidatus Neomarinimicrobiota bacterium]MBT3497068.1 mobile mystery protein B [Candidatus Neomarinimicrobiota bacterium]MBT3691827.1 mobile mystery protein B [Candidatus Neomarinimicrobiota bacterium]MBT3732102.1 mobile mystery protein B [Candidatus Neomarinimicrobiota bacterium]MBT4144884.1 mobile mystery protein B [Candidatus Neomarinimicrobiota bacterium]